jgi:hypothetical protein
VPRRSKHPDVTNFGMQLIFVHGNIFSSHVNIIKLNVDIRKLHGNINKLYLAYLKLHEGNIF